MSGKLSCSEHVINTRIETHEMHEQNTDTDRIQK